MTTPITKKFNRVAIVTLIKNERRWTVFVSALELRQSEKGEKEMWAEIICPTDPELRNPTWVNLDQYTQVNGGGQFFTQAKMNLLAASEPKPAKTERRLIEEGAERLKRLWHLPVM